MMLDILKLSKYKNKDNDLVFCKNIDKEFNYKVQLFNNSFNNSIFKGFPTNNKYNQNYIDSNIYIVYNNNNDFAFCLVKDSTKYKDYLSKNITVFDKKHCSDSYQIGTNNMFKIDERFNFYYCKKGNLIK